MSVVAIGLIGLGLMLVFMFVGIPLAFSFTLSGLIGIGMITGFDTGLVLLKSIPLSQTMTYSMSVLPMFMLMGDLAVAGSLTTDAYATARHWLGRQKAGLAITSTVASAIFGAICGSAQATAMIMGQVAWPEMRKNGYNPKLGVSSIAAAGPLAILIPPSTPMMIYGILAGVSVGKLFMAGWVPGILLCFIMCITTTIIATIKPDWAPRAEKSTLKQKMSALLGALPILVLVIALMFCIWGGVTTVNEAAGMGVILCLVIIILKRRITGQSFIDTMTKTACQAAGLFFMFVGIQVFNAFLSMTGLPGMLTSFVTGLNVSPIGIIWAVVVMYMILGCFMDAPVMMMLTIPLVAPVVAALGFDLVWYGIISALCSALGMITPPVGICLFVIASKCPDVPLSTVMKGIWPYVIATILCIALVIYFPQLALWLPGIMT
jgi:tripartite ATP-independent transporter DctM subunit